MSKSICTPPFRALFGVGHHNIDPATARGGKEGGTISIREQ